MQVIKKLFLLALVICSGGFLHAQDKDTTDLMAQMEKEATVGQINYATATFKTTRLINGHSVENVAKGVLDVRISHRFGNLNSGGYSLWGLDNATMRLGCYPYNV